jgi:hypothetical protein
MPLGLSFWRSFAGEHMNLDLSKYNLRLLSKDNVRGLVESMYTTLDANKKIRAFLLSADRKFVVSCLDELSNDSNAETACNAVELLVALEGIKGITWAAKLLKNEDESVRWAGCHLLSELDCMEAIDYLVQCLRTDPSGNVRFKAAEALATVGDLSTIAPLTRAAENDKGTDFEGRLIRERALRTVAVILARQKK